jgi:hypothetical protein
MLPCAMLICILFGTAIAQQPQGADPIFWCDLSRSQVSHERDAALAQIEALKFRNASLDARVKELEAKAKEATKPNE